MCDPCFYMRVCYPGIMTGISIAIRVLSTSFFAQSKFPFHNFFFWFPTLWICYTLQQDTKPQKRHSQVRKQNRECRTQVKNRKKHHKPQFYQPNTPDRYIREKIQTAFSFLNIFHSAKYSEDVTFTCETRKCLT